MINLKIDGKNISVDENTSIIEAANRLGIHIPTLCYLKEFGPTSSCRICLVEVVGNKNLVTACSYPIFDGMEIKTKSERILKARKSNLELILSNHNYDCKNCTRDNNCELQQLAIVNNCDENRYKGEKTLSFIDNSGFSIQRDNSKCILCKRCIMACNKRQEVNAIGSSGRGFNTHVSSPFEEPLANSNCINCGQCIISCPTGALSEINTIQMVKNYLNGSTKHVIAATAPSVRAGLGEIFGMPIGTDTEKLMITALRQLGFDKVFDVNFSADLTIVEESREFLERYKSGENLPMFTSCCPSWVDYVEKFYPTLKNNLSSCKSPQQMLGVVAKTYYAEKMNIDPKNIVVVGIMPCTSKKTELKLPTMNSSGYSDVDAVLTVREIAKLISDEKINFSKLEFGDFDKLLGTSSGAGVIFGNSGGVMEAALRTLADKISGQDLSKVEYTNVRGLKGIKEAKLNIADNIISIAVVSGLANTKKLLDDILQKKKHYDFVEVMSCPGGCINGGGMPLINSDQQNFSDTKERRISALYSNDQNKTLRKAHQNPEIIELYKWLGKEGGKKAKSLLHIHR